jgi:hypothetical protein
MIKVSRYYNFFSQYVKELRMYQIRITGTMCEDVKVMSLQALSQHLII